MEELASALASRKHEETVRIFCEYLALRREKHRDKLESGGNEEIRGRAKECKDLLSIFA